MKIMHVLRNKDNGKFQAEDQASGGYPYDVEQPYDAYKWDSRRIDEVAKYISMFPQYELVKVELTYEVFPLKVNQPTPASVDG